MTEQENIAAAVTADNADIFRDQLRRLAYIEDRLNFKTWNIGEHLALTKERHEILAPWLDE